MKTQEKGFTLIEVAVALAILLLVISSLLDIFIYTIFWTTANRNLTIATSHAEYALENIQKIPFPSLVAGIEAWDSETIISKGLSSLNSEEIGITVENAGLYEKDIILNVSWKDRGLINRNIAFRTIRTGQ